MRLQQLITKRRLNRKKKKKALAFENAPHRKGVIYKIAVMSPRKPNSARRTFAKVRLLKNDKKLFAKIPGIGEHFLQTHSIVFVSRSIRFVGWGGNISAGGLCSVQI
jgi:small subunit ribosomal protein S12